MPGFITQSPQHFARPHLPSRSRRSSGGILAALRLALQPRPRLRDHVVSTVTSVISDVVTTDAPRRTLDFWRGAVLSGWGPLMKPTSLKN
jgi:hypothetical protein